VSLARERLNTSIDRIHHSLLNINTHDFMAHVSELNSQRQPDLPERNNSDLHERTLPRHLTGSLPRMILPIVFQEPQMDWEAVWFSGVVSGQRAR